MSELESYQKKMTKWPRSGTQFKTEEGKLTLQSCSKSHPLIYAWLHSENHSGSHYVLACPICRFYMEAI